MNSIRKALVASMCLFFQFINAQNEARFWFFGAYAGLDFATSPPTVLTNGSLTTQEGCATISSNSGNLLFYTDGSVVYNSSHVLMPNGTGLFGNNSTTQSALILKQPGSASIYHIFTLGPNGLGKLCYSTVDMSLASGSGSVIVKNIQLADTMTEKLAAARHCNGTDIWVITHQAATAKFKSFLLTSAGVVTTAVVSVTGPSNVGALGMMKCSPSGKMLATAPNTTANSAVCNVYSFDQNTGQSVHQYSLHPGFTSYGCEFSPDGTKLYFAGYNGTTSNLAQYDICVGSASAVAASVYTITSSNLLRTMQVGPDGKIYIARVNQQSLGVINDPNAPAPLCNYVETALAVSPKTCNLGLPNFPFAYTPTLIPFTHTVNSCQSIASFSAPTTVQTNTLIGCAPSGYSITSVQWNFGDPASGAANVSNLKNPSHNYSSSGNYTTTLVVNYSCGKVSDTLRQTLKVVATPSLTIAGIFTVCSGENRSYIVSGASTYSWSTGSTASSVTITHSASAGYTVTGTDTVSKCSSTKIFSVTVNLCTSVLEEEAGPSPIVYPNPADNTVNIVITYPTRFTLINSQGRMIKEITLIPGTHTIDLSELETGVYLIRCVTNSDSRSTRVLKL
jgi:hypothetical protein